MNFEFWIGGQLGRVRQVGRVGWVGQVGRVGWVGRVRQVRKVYIKEVAKCVYEQLDKPTDVEETLKKLAEKMNNNQFTE